ncbi:MAG: cobalt-precorrin-5B (C(1))-methyltransferase [Pseudobacteriovorax sp.]|nr:cobalt-precorrin-5B (C(1))-methyltransferase [Pseudobacteriovorax sp.]
MNKSSSINQTGPKEGMRTGYTTGACAAAVARAAVRSLLTGKLIDKISITIPNGSEVVFDIVNCVLEGDVCHCTTIKDGGDDPDCTHGAEIIASVSVNEKQGISISGGIGVATVTKPGLGLEVGTAAINPVPRKNIRQMVLEELEGSRFCGADIAISVPDGEERAKKTINERLGLIGGISILGTTGVVLPYSTSAFIASVRQSIGLAAHCGETTLVFTTGGRSEQAAIKIRDDVGIQGFIQVGDYIGIAMRQAIRNGFRKVHIIAMMGKLSKIADNRMMTHASASIVNMDMLSQLAKNLGASPAIVQEIIEANTARHVLEICDSNDLSGITSAICHTAATACEGFVKGKLYVNVTMISFSGKIIGERSWHHPNPPTKAQIEESIYAT